jgi:hypothetical protein
MYLDDRPIWGMVGEKYTGEGKADKDTDKFIFTHRRLSVAFNGPRVIEVPTLARLTWVLPLMPSTGGALKERV